MKESKKTTKKINNKNLLFKSTLVLAATVSLSGLAYAVPTSNNLPAPNYVNGGKLQYSSGYTINSNAGALSGTVQNNAANAANASSKLNVDLGTTGNNVAQLGYNTFNIGNGKTVNFNFGATGQAALNRVTQVGDAYASNILGNITQTGKGGAVFVLNPNGILFGANSKINVDSFTASTLNYSSDTLKNPKNKTITFNRGNLNPKGIYFENGAQINTPKSAIFASNGIINNGAAINAGKGNVQLVTGDGVTFKYFYNYESEPVSPANVKASTATPDKVTYPNGVKDNNSAINIQSRAISGHNVSLISKINSPSNTPFDSLVNVDGVITASAVLGSDSGNITLYADNVAPSGRTDAGVAGVKIGNSITAGVNDPKTPGYVNIISDKVSFKQNGSIKADSVNLAPITTNKAIVLGNTPAANAYNVANTGFLDKIDTKKLIIGNGTAENVTGTFDLKVKNGNAVDMQLATKGNIDLKVASTNPNSILNFTNPNNIKIQNGLTQPLDSAVNTLRLGTINSTGNIALNAYSDIIAQNITNKGNIDFKPTYGKIKTGDIVTEGNIDITTEEDNFNSGSATLGNVKAKGYFNFNNFNSDLTAKDITTGGDVSIGGHFAGAKVGNVTSGGNIGFGIGEGSGATAGNLQAAKDVSLGGYQSGITVGNINAGRNINLGGYQTSITAKALKAGNDVEFGGLGSFQNTGNVEAAHNIIGTEQVNYGPNYINTGKMYAGNDINLAIHNITTGDLTAKGNIKEGPADTSEIPQLDSKIENGNICAGKDVTLSAKNNIQTGNIYAGGSLKEAYILDNGTVTKAGSVKNGDIKTGKNVDILANTVNTGNINAGGYVNLTDDTGITTKNISANGEVKILASDHINTGDIYSNANIYVEADNPALGSAVGNVTAHGNVDLKNFQGDWTAKNIYAGKNASVYSAMGTFITGDIKAKENVSAVASEATLKTGNIDAGHNVILNGYDSAQIETGNVKAGKDISIDSSVVSIKTENMSAGQNLVAIAQQEEINLKTKNIKVGGFIYTQAGTQGSIDTRDISAGKDITLSAKTISTGNVCTSGNLKEGLIDQNNNLAKADSITNKNIYAEGDVDIAAKSITTENIKAFGHVNLSDDNAIITKNITAQGDVNVDAGAAQKLSIGDITTVNNVKVSTDGVQDATIGNISANGNAAITSMMGSMAVGNIYTGKNTTIQASLGDFKAKNITSNSNIFIAGGESIVTTGDLTAKGNTTLQGSLIDFKTGNVKAGCDVTLKGSGFSAATGNIDAGRDIIGIGGDLSSNTFNLSSSNLTAKRDINLQLAPIADATVNANDVKAGRDITISAQNINTGNVCAGGNLKEGVVQQDGTLSKAFSVKNNDVYAGNNIDVSANSIVTGNIKAGGHVNLKDDSKISTKNINAGNDITLSLNGGNLETGDLSSGANVLVDINSSDGKIGNINASGGVTLSESGGYGLSVKDINAGKNVKMFVAMGGIDTGKINAGGFVETGIGEGGLNTGDISATDIQLAGNQADIKTGNLKTKYDVIIGQGGSVNVTAGNIDAGLDIIGVNPSQYPYQNSLTAKNLTAKRDIMLTFEPSQGSAINVNDVKAGQDVTLSASNIKTNNITLGRNLKEGSVINDVITKGTSVTNGTINAGKNVNIAANTVVTGPISAGGQINIIKD